MPVPSNSTEGVYRGIFVTKILAQRANVGRKSNQKFPTVIIPRAGWTKGGSDVTRVQELKIQ